MLIAQTGPKPLPLLDLPLVDNATSYSLWWLVPIALIIVGVTWFIRRQMKRTEKKSRPTFALSTKIADRKTRKVADREVFVASESLAQAEISERKNGKSKKRERRRNDQHDKSAVSLQPKIPEPLLNRASELTQTALKPSGPSTDLNFDSPPMPQPSMPVNAIFEPLRDVSQHRRKPIFTSPNAPSQTGEPLGPTQRSGGKFERTETSAKPTRSVATRWPASATQQVVSAVTASPRPQLPSTADSKLSQATVVAVPTAPANGLKSFVSKIKGSVPTSSDSETTFIASSETKVQSHPTPPDE